MALSGKAQVAGRFQISREIEGKTTNRVKRAFLAGGWILAVAVVSSNPAQAADNPEETEEIYVRGAGYEEYIALQQTSARVWVDDILVIGMKARSQRQTFAVPEAHVLRRISSAQQDEPTVKRASPMPRTYGSGIRYASGIQYGSGLRRSSHKRYGADIRYGEGMQYGSGFRRPSIDYGKGLRYGSGYRYGSGISYGAGIRYGGTIRYGR